MIDRFHSTQYVTRDYYNHFSRFLFSFPISSERPKYTSQFIRSFNALCRAVPFVTISQQFRHTVHHNYHVHQHLPMYGTAERTSPPHSSSTDFFPQPSLVQFTVPRYLARSSLRLVKDRRGGFFSVSNLAAFVTNCRLLV